MKSFTSKFLLSITLLYSFANAKFDTTKIDSMKVDSTKFVANPNIIFFDVERTLIDISNYLKVAYDHFGLGSAIRGLFQGNLDDFYSNHLNQIETGIPAPELKVTLNKAATKDGKKDEKRNNTESVLSLNGKKLSELECHYLLGRLSSTECIKKANEWVDKNSDKFANDFQKELFKKMVSFYFDPKTFISFHKSTKSMDLMKKFFEVKDKDGKRKNIIIVCANQPKEAISLLKEAFVDISKFSDLQVFSSEVNRLNQDPELLKSILNVCPKKSRYYTFFIDASSLRNHDVTFDNPKKTIEFINVNDAEAELNANGALTIEA